MFKSIWEDVKRAFSSGNMMKRLIIINVAVFVVINLVRVILWLSSGGVPGSTPFYNEIVRFFMISSDWWHNLTHPWVLFTNMFLHEDIWHILWNMLFLYWFGRIVGDFIGDQRILPLYLLGGLVGALAFFISVNLLPYGEGGPRYALGASGAIMAIVVAAGTISPDYTMRLLFIGYVKLKYIVAALVFIDLIGMAGNYNTGGHFAHLGGALLGWIFVKQLRDGNDLSIPINNVLNQISLFFGRLTGTVRPKKGPRVVYRNTTRQRPKQKVKANAASDSEDMSHQEQLDAILDKIKQSGYDSLSEEEKEFLFNASKK